MQSEPLLVLRTDLIAELGENLPDTWEDVHRIGKKLKAKGHPPGKFLTASLGYNQPFLKAFSMHPIYASNPKFYFAPYMSRYIHAVGWPGVPTAAQAVADQFIIPDDAAAHAAGRLTAEKAGFQIERICRRHA